MVFHAARRRHALDAEHEGLVFGRLDLRTGSDLPRRPAGRARRERRAAGRRLAGARRGRVLPGHRRRARAGVVRRRMIQSSGERVTGIEDDLLDPDAAPPDMRVVGDGALLATLARATGHGMRDIVATIQREQDEAIRSPGSGVTIVSGGPGTGKTAVALHRAAYLLYSDRNRFAGGGILVVGPSSVFVDYIAAVLPVARRGLGDPALARLDGAGLRRRPAPTRRRWRRSRARCGCAGCWSGPPTTPCRTAPTELRLLYRGTLLRLDRRAAGPRSATGRCPAAPGATRSAGPASTGCSTRCGRRRSALKVAGAAEPVRLRGRAVRPRGLPRRSCGPGGRGCCPGTCWAGSPTRRGCAGTPPGCSPPPRSTLLTGTLRRRTTRRSPTWRCSTSSTSCSAGPARPARKQRDPFHVVDGVREVSTDVRPAARPPAPPPCAGRRTTASTRTWWSTRRRTSRRCSGGCWAGAGGSRPGRSSATRRRPRGPATRPSSTGPATGRWARRRRHDVHADHQLPQLGGDLRGRRGGDPRGRSPTWRCRRRCARPGVEPVDRLGAAGRAAARGRGGGRGAARRGARARSA